jgi:predicted lipid-binding transport protein (Tim44 family)
MKRTLALALLIALAIIPVLSVTEAWARAGGGSSSGSRGSRSYTSPARPGSSPVSPSQPSSPAVSPAQPRPGWGGMMGGMLGGLLLGGLLGGLLFGGGFGSGIGMMEIVIIAALAWFAISYMRRRQAAAASAPAYAMAGGGYAGPGPRDDAGMSARYGSASSGGGTATLEPPPAGPSDLERGLGHVRQMDGSFDPRVFAETASDVFFKIQGAWTARDLRSVSAHLTPEMQAQLQRDCDRLRTDQKINRLENIAVRSADITEVWQETGQDYVTVHFLASLLDYTTDESGARVLEGSRTEPVKFEEYWTFVRPVGPGPFKLSAIQQS